MAVDVVTVDLYQTNGTTFVSTLVNARGVKWQHELSKAGTGSFEVPLADAGAITDRTIVKFSWRGSVRFAVRIVSEHTVVAVDGRIWVKFENQPGLLSMLGDAVVYPEYGLTKSSQDQRRFGYMSALGPWRISGDWVAPMTHPWGTPGPHYKSPAEFEAVDSLASWIAAPPGPDVTVPGGTVNYFRRTLVLAEEKRITVHISGDNDLELYIDGDIVVSTSGDTSWTYQSTGYYPVTLEAGTHLIAAKVINGPAYGPYVGSLNPLGLICSVIEMDDSGNPVGVLTRTDATWAVADNVPEVGWARGSVLYQLFAEARSRGAYGPSKLTSSFTALLDSQGDAWTDRGEYSFAVGTQPLDSIASQIAESTMDIDVDPATMKLNAYVRKGVDLSSFVMLQSGQNLVSYETSRTAPRSTRVLVRDARGAWLETVDGAAETAYGRSEMGLTVGTASSPAAAQGISDAVLAEAAHPLISVTGEASTLTSPVPYVDYDLGDTISCPGSRGVGVIAARVISITVDASGASLRAWPELIYDPSV